MKILSKEEEDAHYMAVLKGGSVGTLAGLIGGTTGVMAASRRWSTIRHLTLPMKAFLVTSTGTFTGIIAADHSSRSFDTGHQREKSMLHDREARLRHAELERLTTMDRVFAFARKEKYKLITASWIVSMVGSFMIVKRNPYLTGPQKLVQARVYAQGLTLGVLCATAALEINDQKRGAGILDKVQAKHDADKLARGDSTEDLWIEMVDAEEERMKQREAEAVKTAADSEKATPKKAGHH